MDDHDQLKFFFFFVLFFVCRRFQSRERRRSARKRIIQFAMLNRMEHTRRELVSLLPVFALAVSHEMENKKYWTAILVDSASALGFGNLGGAAAFLDVNFKCKRHPLFCRESKTFIYIEKSMSVKDGPFNS